MVVIPEQMKAEFLECAHDKGGHQGLEKTSDKLKMIAYWVGMQLAVTEYVNSCDRCQKAKLPLPTRAPLLNTPLVRSLEMLQVDVLEVPISSEGNSYLLVIEDSFSKWLEAYPMNYSITKSPQMNSRPHRVRKPPKYLKDYVHD